jgi:hypothetical protein
MIGMAFWPATLVAAMFCRPGRPIALWAAGTFLIVAFVPFSFIDGPRFFPWFDGRNILVVCVPFALCFGWMICAILTRIHGWRWLQISVPSAIAVVTVLSLNSRADLNAAQRFHQRDVGRAIRTIVAAHAWADERPIYMPPSLYWRYAVLLPDELRSRLRVAANAEDSTWWCETSRDIRDRWQPLPEPQQAYLLATPAQIRGLSHPWDYGVTLPSESLERWRKLESKVVVSRFTDGTIRLSPQVDAAAEPLIVLLGPLDAENQHLAESRFTN